MVVSPQRSPANCRCGLGIGYSKIMRNLLGFILVLVKWPLAIAVALCTPATAVAFWQLLCGAWAAAVWKSPFGIGFIVAGIAWLLFSRTKIVGFLSTMEHELTHAIAAWMTFVPVIELRSTDGTTGSDSMGHVRLGGSNWLISSAPYFFPTVSAAVLIATWALAATPTDLARGLLGAATAYSVFSTWREMHFHQTDLKQISFPFAFLFLPGANMLCYGLLLANELGGPSKAGAYTVEAIHITRGWIGM